MLLSRKTIQKYPLLVLLLGIVFTAGMFMLWQWWKKRRNASALPTDPESTDCNWKVTFQRSEIPVFEWVGIISYAQANWGVTEPGTGAVLTFTVTNEIMKILQPFVEKKGWKYEKERIC